ASAIRHAHPTPTLFPYTTLFRSRAVAALAPGDFGRRGERLKDPEAFAASVRRLEPQLGALRGTSGQVLAQDMVNHATEWQLERRSEEHTSELQSRGHLVCRLLLE